MTAAEMARLVGREGTIEVIRFPGVLQVAVRVVDVRMAYGRVRYQVEPVAGTGTAWVQSITISEEGRP